MPDYYSNVNIYHFMCDMQQSVHQGIVFSYVTVYPFGLKWVLMVGRFTMMRNEMNQKVC